MRGPLAEALWPALFPALLPQAPALLRLLLLAAVELVVAVVAAEGASATATDRNAFVAVTATAKEESA